MLTNRLKPSERRHFRGYNNFTISNEECRVKLFEKIKDNIQNQSITFEVMNADKVIAAFIDTPRRFCKIVNSAPEKNIFSVIEEEINEEIERKCAYEIDYQSCREFMIRLAYETLNRRGNSSKSPIIPENMVNSRLLQSMPGGEQAAINTWEIIQKKLILIEQSSNVNSYEFSNNLFFEELIAEYLMDYLENESGVKCYGTMMNVLSKLSGNEFSRVLLNIIGRISNYDRSVNTNVSESNLDILMKIIVGITFSFEIQEDREACLWTLNNIVANKKLVDSFLKSGKYEKRSKMLRMMGQLITAMENNKY